MMSAYAPGATTPISPDIPSISAPFEVAAWIAAIGVIPNSTMRENSRAIGSALVPPVFQVNMAAGHGGASGRYDYLREIAFDYAFILTRLAPFLLSPSPPEGERAG